MKAHFDQKAYARMRAEGMPARDAFYLARDPETCHGLEFQEETARDNEVYRGVAETPDGYRVELRVMHDDCGISLFDSGDCYGTIEFLRHTPDEHEREHPNLMQPGREWIRWTPAEPVRELARQYRNQYGRLDCYRKAKAQIEREREIARQYLNGDLFSVGFVATAYDPEGEEIGECSVWGFWWHAWGRYDSGGWNNNELHAMMEHSAPECLGYIRDDQESRALEASFAT